MEDRLGPKGEGRRKVAEFCSAVRQAMDQLWLEAPVAATIIRQLEVAEEAADSAAGDVAMQEAVRAIRYHLLESADGPLAPFLADAAARILGDGHGRLFF